MNPPLDITGAPITPHCLFLYSAEYGGSTRLSWGRVEKISPKGDVVFQGVRPFSYPPGSFRFRDKLSTLYSTDKIVVIPWNRKLPDGIRQALDPDGAHAASLGQNTTTVIG